MTNAEAIETLRANYPDACYEQLREAVDAAIEALKAQDTSWERVVRCRDCKYSDTLADTTTQTMPLKCLNIRYGGVYPDWYCEHGERKDEKE